MENDNQAESMDGDLMDFYMVGTFGRSYTRYAPDPTTKSSGRRGLEEELRSPREFYSRWMGFATRKSFRWLDKWRLRDAGSRSEKRLMEKENRKQREAGKRAYNEAVRVSGCLGLM